MAEVAVPVGVDARRSGPACPLRSASSRDALRAEIAKWHCLLSRASAASQTVLIPGGSPANTALQCCAICSHAYRPPLCHSRRRTLAYCARTSESSSPALRVVAFARPHRVHLRAGVHDHLNQLHVGRSAYPVPHGPLHFQQLPDHRQMQGGRPDNVLTCRAAAAAAPSESRQHRLALQESAREARVSVPAPSQTRNGLLIAILRHILYSQL